MYLGAGMTAGKAVGTSSATVPLSGLVVTGRKYPVRTPPEQPAVMIPSDSLSGIDERAGGQSCRIGGQMPTRRPCRFPRTP